MRAASRFSLKLLHLSQCKGQWYAKPVSGGTAQKLNMKGIQRHGKKWRVQKRSNGQLRKWTFGTLKEAQRKRDIAFG